MFKGTHRKQNTAQNQRGLIGWRDKKIYWKV